MEFAYIATINEDGLEDLEGEGFNPEFTYHVKSRTKDLLNGHMLTLREKGDERYPESCFTVQLDPDDQPGVPQGFKIPLRSCGCSVDLTLAEMNSHSKPGLWGAEQMVMQRETIHDMKNKLCVFYNCIEMAHNSMEKLKFDEAKQAIDLAYKEL